MELLVLKGGVPAELVVAPGETSGLDVAVTAYPLILARAGNRIATGTPIPAEPGSYLLLVRAPGFEDQRDPVVVPRNGAADVAVELEPAGRTPVGYVYIPPGPFVYGGDPEAFLSAPRQVKVVAGFRMAVVEVTTAEWFEFVNTPSTLKEIEQAKKTGEAVYLPRQPGMPLGFAKRRSDGTYESELPDHAPVLGISRNDITGYLAWRNRRAQEDGDPWVYDLPTDVEWEKAARGVDARLHPWGDRCDPSLCLGSFRKPESLFDSAGGSEPRDESPFGILDLAGSRYEWTRDVFAPGSKTYAMRGGAWSVKLPSGFRAAKRQGLIPTHAFSRNGFRLVVRPRPR